jgi:zinc transport system permease protein
MAVGVLLLHVTPTYTDLTSYLFGNILLIGKTDLILVAVLDAVVLITCTVFYREFTAISFDAEFANVRGLPQSLLYYGLLALTAITVVLLVNLVGIVLMLALITLPAAMAGRFSASLWQMMLGGALLTAVFTTLGLALSYPLNLPSGPVIILVTGILYLTQLGIRRLV